MKLNFWLVATGLIISNIALAAEDFSVGFAVNPLLPAVGASLAGYFERHLAPWEIPPGPIARFFPKAMGQHDPLRVKAAAMSRNHIHLVLVSVDLVGISPDWKRPLEAKLSRAIGEPVHVVLTASHTHSGFGSYVQNKLWEYLAADRYSTLIADSIREAISVTALASLRREVPARYRVLRSTENGLARDRRKNIPLDSKLNLWQFVDASGHLLGSFVHLAIHGDLLPPENLILSSDTPGEIERQTEALTRGPALFLSGAAGDVDPESSSRTFAGLAEFGTVYASKLRRVLASHVPFNELNDLSWTEGEHPLDPPTANLHACVGIFGNFNVPFNLWLPQSFAVPAPISALRLDKNLLIFLPGEPLQSVGNRVESLGTAKGFTTSVVGLADHYLGYILSDDEYKMGGYEACNSFYGPHYAERIVTGVENQLRFIK